jgi:hypothetical protein
VKRGVSVCVCVRLCVMSNYGLGNRQKHAGNVMGFCMVFPIRAGLCRPFGASRALQRRDRSLLARFSLGRESLSGLLG